MGVAFSYDNFAQTFPEFTAVQPDQVQFYWNMAFGWFDNTGWPGNLPIAQIAMNLLTAHLLWLFSMRDANGNPSSAGTAMPSALVGRINSASEGSVSIGSEFNGMAGGPNEKWFNQTRYGAAFWALTAPWRTAVYIPRNTPMSPNNAFYPIPQFFFPRFGPNW